MFQTQDVEKIKTHFVFSNSYRAGQATDDNMAHARCMMDT